MLGVRRRRGTQWGVTWVVLAVSFLVAATAQAQVATESSGEQVDAQHSGYVYGAGVDPPLTEAWSSNVGWDNASVAIDGGHAFAIEAVSGGDDALESIDLASGDVAWTAPLGDASEGNANLALDSGLVFTAVGTSPANTTSEPFILSAWNEQTGAPVWSEVLSDFSDEGAAYPIVHDGVLYLTMSGTAYAIQERNGAVLWSTGVTSEMMTLVGGTLVVGGGGCNEEAGLNAATGEILWSENTYACTGGVTYVSSTNGTYLWSPIDGPSWAGPPWPTIYDPATGAVLGTSPETGAVAFGYGEAVAVTANQDIEAFDPASQAVRWSSELGNGDDYSTLPLLADGFVFEAANPAYVYPAAQGYVEAIDACTGVTAWQAPLSGVNPDSQIDDLAAGDGYLVVSTDGGLEAFEGSGMPPDPPPNCNPTSPPTALAPPGIAGAAEVGQVLSESDAAWSGSPLTFSYQWQRCDADGGDCVAIAGTDSTSYTVGSPDVGHTIVVSETATNADGSSQPAVSAPTGIVVSPPASDTGAVTPTPAAPRAVPTTTAQTPTPMAKGLTVREVEAALRAALGISKGHARIRALLRARGYTAVFNAPAAGTLQVRWLAMSDHRSRLVAYARRRLTAKGRTLIRIEITPLGLQLLRADKRLRLTATGTFAPVSGATISASRTITLLE
jgi:hypothetical protein